MPGVILLAAGGTGGHLFPAEALARALNERGWRVHLATDHRAESYGQDFPAEETHIISSATFSRSPVVLARAGLHMVSGIMASRRLVKRIQPRAAVGFGGYPTVPPMLAAVRAKVPTIIHEQNAVLGRANKFLASRVGKIATGFAEVGGIGAFAVKAVETGNPVRAAVREAAAAPYPVREASDPFRLLVFGGSQGARFMSEVLPPAVALIPAELRSGLRIVQQCRAEDLDGVAERYREMSVEAELQPFFRDMPRRIADSHLVIARAGASTVAELTVIGRPAIMIPLPNSLDQDQKANATMLARAGGGWMVEQKEMTPQRLAAELTLLIERPGDLAAAASVARRLGRPDAVERLADLVAAAATAQPGASR